MKIKKHIIITITVISTTMVLWCVPIAIELATPVTIKETRYSALIGDTTTTASERRRWISGTTIVMLSRDRTTISVWGIGDMDSYCMYHCKYDDAPWAGYKIPKLGLIIGDGITSELINRVIIRRGVRYIGTNTFLNLKNLKSITIYSTVPPTIHKNAFHGINKSNVCLYVPTNSINAYRTAEGWKEFNCIKDLASAPAPPKQ